MGVRGDDLRALRLRARLADRARSTLARDRAAFAVPFTPRGSVRLLGLEEAAKLFPPLYDQVFAQRPGMFDAQQGVVGDAQALPTIPPGGAAARCTARCSSSTASRPGYALYRVAQDWERVQQGNGDDPGGRDADARGDARAVALAARLRLDVAVRGRPAAARPPLFLLLAEPRRMQFQVERRGVGAADRHRGGAVGPQLHRRRRDRARGDGRLPARERGPLARHRRGGERTEAAADLRLDVAGLGSVYLGGFGFATRRALARRGADRGCGRARRCAFAPSIEPWCAEIF